MAKNFIAGAILHPGALTAEAKAAGEGTQQFAREHAHSSGKVGQRARFALFLNKVRPGGKKKTAAKKNSAFYGE